MDNYSPAEWASMVLTTVGSRWCGKIPMWTRSRNPKRLFSTPFLAIFQKVLMAKIHLAPGTCRAKKSSTAGYHLSATVSEVPDYCLIAEIILYSEAWMVQVLLLPGDWRGGFTPGRFDSLKLKIWVKSMCCIDGNWTEINSINVTMPWYFCEFSITLQFRARRQKLLALQ